MTASYRIEFEPVGRRGESPSESSLLETARRMGVGLSGLCGGHGLTGMVAYAWGETDVPGLFAAGDCLANPYGFLPGAMCMGEAVGERVVNKAYSMPDDNEVGERLALLESAIARHRKGA